jgi:hypothetical protein
MSTGDRTILGRITKRGNRYLRTMIMQGARVILLRPANWAKHSFGPWLTAAANRLHHNVLATALANKLARIAWTVLMQAAATKHAATNKTRRYPPRSASWIDEMEKRSRRRTRDLVTQAASQGLSQNEIGCARISMMARSTNAPCKGRIQMRKTNPLHFFTFGLQRTAGRLIEPDRQISRIRLLWGFVCQGGINPFLSSFVIPFFCSTCAASILSSRPHICIAVARRGGQGRRFFSAAEGLSLTDASTAAGC